MLRIPLSQTETLFSAINEHAKLYLPIEADDLIQFKQWLPDAIVRLDKLNTAMSPKDFFFPHTENIAAFKRHKKEITIEDSCTSVEPFIIFGLRACDAESLNLLDKVFLCEPVDTFYKARRESCILITSACFQPEESCFCGVFGIDATNPSGDIVTWVIEDTLYWKPLTEGGMALTEKLKGLLAPADNECEIATEKQKAKEVFAKLPFADLCLENFTPDALIETFNSPQWTQLYATCIGCGTCTFICPTCHCYDIQDFDACDKVIRHRCWDSCMYSDFTLMAHGNPRTSQLERFRQRFMHKLIYFPDNNNGTYACVGCGRCVQKCPVAMSIVKVAKALAKTAVKSKG